MSVETLKKTENSVNGYPVNMRIVKKYLKWCKAHGLASTDIENWMQFNKKGKT